MREYTVNLPLQHIELGEPIDRAAWPLHVTIQSNVTTDADPEVVVDAVRAAVDDLSPVHAVVGEEAHFGPDGSFLVNLVESADLRAVHDVVHARLRDDVGAESLNPRVDGDGFNAHVTATARGRVRRGDEIDLDMVLLAEVGPGGDRGVAMPVATFILRPSDARRDDGPRPGQHPR